MLNLTGIGKSIAGWSSGFNFYKWGAILALLLAYGAAMNYHGKHGAELKCEKAKTALAEQHTRDIVSFVNVQSRATTVDAKRAAEIATAVDVAAAALDEETRNKADLAECRISEKRLKALNSIAEQTRRR